jgi:branched-chain amino acid aminotransferase
VSTQVWSSDEGLEKAAGLVVYINGEHIPAAEAKISVFDSGFNFADGVFEGLRVYNGGVYRLDDHVRRLYESARAFSIDIGMSRQQFTAEILNWLRANRIREDFHFRPIVTRGDRFPPRLDPKFAQARARIIMVGGPIRPASRAGQRVVISSYRRVAPDALDPRIKSLNYGNNLMGRLDAGRRHADDAVMLDSAGFVAEASAANIFVYRRGRLLTPLPKACLEGITRDTVIQIAQREGIPCEERDLTPTELLNADEVFLCGTGTELSPVVEVEGSKIGSGEIGPITERLLSIYGELVRTEGTPIWP